MMPSFKMIYVLQIQRSFMRARTCVVCVCARVRYVCACALCVCARVRCVCVRVHCVCTRVRVFLLKITNMLPTSQSIILYDSSTNFNVRKRKSVLPAIS